MPQYIREPGSSAEYYDIRNSYMLNAQCSSNNIYYNKYFQFTKVLHLYDDPWHYMCLSPAGYCNSFMYRFFVCLFVNCAKGEVIIEKHKLKWSSYEHIL